MLAMTCKILQWLEDNEAELQDIDYVSVSQRDEQDASMNFEFRNKGRLSEKRRCRMRCCVIS